MQFIADSLGNLFLGLMAFIIGAVYLMMFMNKQHPDATQAGKKAAGETLGNILLRIFR